MPCLRIAQAHAGRGASVFRYRLTYPAPGGAFKGTRRMCWMCPSPSTM
jgi:para-nitrobenzyl esterase